MLSIAASPASLRPRVLELGRGGGAESAPLSGARSAEYPSGARVNESKLCSQPEWYGKFKVVDSLNSEQILSVLFEAFR